MLFGEDWHFFCCVFLSESQIRGMTQMAQIRESSRSESVHFYFYNKSILERIVTCFSGRIHAFFRCAFFSEPEFAELKNRQNSLDEVI